MHIKYNQYMKMYKILTLFAIILLLWGCENPWDEHVRVNENVLQESIGDYLVQNPEFSSFVELLNSTGLNSVLSSSVIFTVWAPTNDAIKSIDQTLINTEAKKKLFVQNHIAFGSYSSKENNATIRIKMRSGKVLEYNASEAIIDNIIIDRDKEAQVKNGTIQVLNNCVSPRYSMWEYLNLDAPENKFISFLKSLTKTVFHEELSAQIGINELGKPVYDSVWIVQNDFLNYVDISSEDIQATLIVPSDEVFEAEFNKFQKYFRVEDRRNNEVPSSKDSINIMANIAIDWVLNGNYPASETTDTVLSFHAVKVPFNSNSFTSSYKASNGFIHFSNNCSVKITAKIKPILIEAENRVYSLDMASGTPTPYYRLRENASNGMDFICDNSNTSKILSGVIFYGPKVSSIKYRIKIRAINDFGKSYRNSDTSTVMIQKLGTVTVLRDPVTNMISKISEVTNSLNYTDTKYGIADVKSDTIFVPKKDYSPLGNAADDEIDLGYYEFNKSDNVFFRLTPLATRMAVTADYIRLDPIIEE